MTRASKPRLMAGWAALTAVTTLLCACTSGPGSLPATTRASASAEVGGLDGQLNDLGLNRLPRSSIASREIDRNPFRFGSASVRRAPAERSAPVVATSPNNRPASEPPPRQPTIPLRYIGILDAPTQAGRVGILSDGRGHVFHAREGDIIEGRYLVGQIDPAAVELSFLDGRGRQAIRLSGQ